MSALTSFPQKLLCGDSKILTSPTREHCLNQWREFEIGLSNFLPNDRQGECSGNLFENSSSL